MTDQSDWASQLSAAIHSQFGARPRTVELYSVRAVSPEVIEIIHSDPGGRGVRGIRIDHTSVLSARERISESSIAELAFDLVYVGMEEPKPEEDFLPPDKNGITWLRLDRWLDENS